MFSVSLPLALAFEEKEHKTWEKKAADLLSSSESLTQSPCQYLFPNASASV